MLQAMVKFSVALAAVFSAIVSASNAEQHPVREEIVEEIKLKATSWKAKPVNDNHMRHRSVESIKNSMGHLGAAPKILPTDFLKTMAHSASDLFK